MIFLLDTYINGKIAHINRYANLHQNISIADNSTIGAGAVVTRNIADNQIVKGNPAK